MQIEITGRCAEPKLICDHNKDLIDIQKDNKIILNCDQEKEQTADDK